MQFEVVQGDILEQDVDVIVVPHLSKGGIMPELTAKIYSAAGYQDMADAFQAAKEKAIEEKVRRNHLGSTRLSDKNLSILSVTPGFNLRAKHAIHINVHAEEWRDGQTETERKKKVNDLEYCYYSVLMHAFCRLHAMSVAVPLMGTSLLGFPVDVSREAAERAASKLDFFTWHRERNAKRKTYIIIPDSKEEEVVEEPEVSENSIVRITDENFQYHGVFEQFEKDFYADMKASVHSNSEYKRITCLNYLVSGTQNQTQKELATLLGVTPSIISKFISAVNRNGTGNIPRDKRRVIAIAIGMGLEDYDRFKFIRCIYDAYPGDPLDYQVETIILSGIKGFNYINKELCKIDPAFDLKAPVRINKPQTQTKSKSKSKSEKIK